MNNPLTSGGMCAACVVVPVAAAAAATGGARLSFDNGLEQFRLRPHRQPGVLLEARFGEPLPVVWGAGHEIHIEYPLGARLGRRARPSVILLNPAITWSLDVHGSATHLDADLTSLPLRSLALHSGIAHSRLALGWPSAEHAVRLSSVKDLRIERPHGVPVRIELARGATGVTLDQRRYRAVSGGVTGQTAGYRPSTSRYLIIATAGVDGLTITSHRQSRCTATR